VGLLLVVAPVPATLLEVVVTDGLLTQLGQICFFLVNTSQYTVVAVFQNI